MEHLTCYDEATTYYIYYNEIVHSISDENKQFIMEMYSQKHHRIKTKSSEWMDHDS